MIGIIGNFRVSTKKFDPKERTYGYDYFMVKGGCCQVIDAYGLPSCSHIDVLIPEQISGTYRFNPKIDSDKTYTKEAIKEWVDFINKMGFNFELLKEVFFTPYDIRTNCKFFIVRMYLPSPKSAYPKYNLLAYSILRYMTNDAHEYEKLYERAIALDKLLPNIDNLVKLHLAHKMTDSNRRTNNSVSANTSYSSYYGLFSHDTLDKTKLLSSSTLQNRIAQYNAETDSHNINAITTTEFSRITTSPKNLLTALDKGDANSLLTYIKNIEIV